MTNTSSSTKTKTSTTTTTSTSTSTTTMTKNNKEKKRILNINVGVLGHVDSGKTSLVKTLSTLLSTASLDKSSQSRQRGITLDLGFSAFLVDELPPQLLTKSHKKKQRDEEEEEEGEGEEEGEEYDCLQVTLVDCPGHASLIRTIIGGAQIIDMVLLVIDATKGIQTQTAECLVIAELTTRNLIVALNKIDLFPQGEEEREKRIENVKRRIKGALSTTKFGQYNKDEVPMVPVSAAVGGEKVAAATTIPSNNATATLQSTNIDTLLSVIKSKIQRPNRKNSNQSNKFYFAIDHCFPIRGQGTVLTGTVLSGYAKVNDVVALPELGSHMERKIKSMQMFKRQVMEVRQGDRCGICLSNLDAKLIERGVAASPGTVGLIDCAIAIVRKVRFFRGNLASDFKFHLSVGHSTVMSTVKFFGAKELHERLRLLERSKNNKKEADVKEGGGVVGAAADAAAAAAASASLGGTAISGLPRLEFDFDQDFEQQDGMLESLPSTSSSSSSSSSTAADGKKGSGGLAEPPLHWAILTLHTPVYCPWNSLVIGSRLDTDVVHPHHHHNQQQQQQKQSSSTSSSSSSSASSCRLAFSGRLIQPFHPTNDISKLKLYTWKEKRGIISRLGPEVYKRSTDNAIVRYEVYGHELFKKETIMTPFVGMIIFTSSHQQQQRKEEMGVIQSSFGTSGKFKVYFPQGTECKEGDELILRFKRYSNDPKKGMHQDYVLPPKISGIKIEQVKKKKKGKKDRSFAAAAAPPGGGVAAAAAMNKKNDSSIVATPPSPPPAAAAAGAETVSKSNETKATGTTKKAKWG